MDFPFPSHFVQAGDLRVHYMKQGRGEPLILLHGWPQTSHEWHNQLRSLARHFTVYAPDNRGFGATDKPRIRITRDLLARDVVRFMDALALEDAFVAGHDWGGIIAFKLAVDFPERVRRLCLIDTSTTVWPTFAAHAYWANLHPEPLAFLAKYSKEMIEWCMRGTRPDYRDVVAPFPPDPLPGAGPGWCDDRALQHYVEAMADPGSHFATVEYYGSGLPMHRVRGEPRDGVEFDYIGAHGARAIWNHPGGPMGHPDLARPLCYAPEDWNKKFPNPAMYVYTPLLVPAAFERGVWNPDYAFGHDLWQHSIVRPFERLRTSGIPCGHFIPEERPEALDPLLIDFFS